jgi:hypothetical protein
VRREQDLSPSSPLSAMASATVGGAVEAVTAANNI